MPVPPWATAKSVVNDNEAADVAPKDTVPVAVRLLEPAAIFPPTVKVLPTANVHDTSPLPSKSKLSVICTVPPLESNIRLPDEVSISLSAVTPNLTLPAKTPPN